MAKEKVEIEVWNSSFDTVRQGIGDETEVTFRGAHGTAIAFDKITTIAISEEISRVPSWLSRFPNLEVLDLAGSRLVRITQDDMIILRGFPRLRHLGLAGKFTGGLPDELAALPGLEELGLGTDGLSTLPETLHRLVSLKKISLSNGDYPEYIKNHFPEFPPVLLRMKGLRELYIANVGMERFPAAKTSGLVALERLDISR
ncbi:MAG: leucine-rich repeat domain-containing protein, partial [Candidatus Sigynarchaeota archaeon]